MNLRSVTDKTVVELAILLGCISVLRSTGASHSKISWSLATMHSKQMERRVIWMLRGTWNQYPVERQCAAREHNSNQKYW